MWSEDRLHRWLERRLDRSPLAGSLMHDAVVLHRMRGRPTVCVDATIEGVHFEPGAPPARVGAKAAGRALSDLAATAARPRAILVALSAPRAAREAWIRRALAGLARAGERHGAPLTGGDLACVEGPRSLVVTAIGEVAATGKPVGRDRARPGQLVVLTGPVGGSRLGRHLAPEPRLAAGAWLARRGATAMMDVSDGLAWDVFRLARASGVAIELESVPVHPDARRAARLDGKEPLDHALHDGEDHELIATVPRAVLARLEREARRHCPGLEVVGRVVRGRGVRVARDGELVPWDPARGGWRHGGGHG